MAKVSKYKQLIGKVINDVMIVDYERQERVSKKSGKTYKVTRLYVTADGENMLEIGTASFNKMSFLKRLAKITTKWIYKEQPVDELRQDVESFRSIASLDELKKTYRYLSKKYHPDLGGNADSFKVIKREYEKCKTMLEAMVETFAEFGYEFEPVSEPVNESVEPVKYELMPFSYLWFRLKTEFDSELEKDIYELEHIDDIEQAKAKWRELSKKYHPDCGGNAKDFQAIRYAYEEHMKDLRIIKEAMMACGLYDELAMYYPAVISEKPISADIIAKHVNTLENILCFKELKQEFHKLAGIYHPDKGGNAQVFAQLLTIYNINGTVLKRTEKKMKARLDEKAYKDIVRKLINIEKAEQGYGF